MMVRHRRSSEAQLSLTPEERAHLDSMTERQAYANALADPDNPPLTEQELAGLRRVADVKSTRERLGLSQADFARRYRFSIGRLRDLEQGRTRADSVVSAYLRLIEKDPDYVAEALAT